MPDPDPANTGPAAPPSIDDAEDALDLGSVPAAPNAASGGTGGAAGVEDVDLGNTRKTIAYFLLWILVGIILVVVIVSLAVSVDCWLNNTRCTQASTALTLLTTNVSPLFTAMVGLVGSVVGFYFGSRQA